jgi:hypothetical protein
MIEFFKQLLFTDADKITIDWVRHLKVVMLSPFAIIFVLVLGIPELVYCSFTEIIIPLWKGEK